MIIRNVKVYDGTGSKPFISDVLIERGKISYIGRIKETGSSKVIDGTKLALAPGFINTHSHSDLEVFRDKKMQHAIRQGITTEIVGQDGSSVAPVSDEILEELEANMAPLAGVIGKHYWWRSFKEYLSEVRNVNANVRIEGLFGHGTIRMFVMENESRKPTDYELEKMKQLTAQCMNEGARGMSLGLIYPPGSYADTDEIIEISKVIANYDGIVMVHMRNEQDRLMESIDEMARVARESGVRMHISHLKALGYRNWGKTKQALEKICQLRNEGMDITFDHYPYAATSTGLKVVVPTWAYEGGEQGFQERLDVKEEYEKILKGVNENIKSRGGADKILIASVKSEENSWMVGKNLMEISEKIGIESGEAVLWVLKVEGPYVVAIYFSLSEEDVANVMRSPLQVICTDGILGEHPHPRAYGSFPRVLGYYCREKKIMTMEEAIRKMTMEPARRLRLWDRGIIREGMSADLVLFDPESISDKNDFLNPAVYPSGIAAVWVKGNIMYEDFNMLVL